MNLELAAVVSNNLVYSAIAAWAFSLLALAAEVAFGSRSRVGRLTRLPAPSRGDAVLAGRLGQGQGSAGPDSAGPDTAGQDSVGQESVGQGSGGQAVAREPAGDGGSSPGGDQPKRLSSIGSSLFVLGTVLLLGAVLARGLAAQRVPWGNMYEFAITGSLVAAAALLVARRRFDLDALTLWLVTVLLLSLGLAVAVLYVPAGPLVPALRSVWLLIHVLAAIVAAGVFTVSMLASGLQILAERAERRPQRAGGYLRRVPDSAVLDRVAYRMTAFGFPIWTFAVVAGAIWAEAAWGRYWGWDPKEVWALITWLVYAAYLHARATAGWRGSRASVVALVAYATLLFDFFGVNIFFVGFHSYGGV